MRVFLAGCENEFCEVPRIAGHKFCLFSYFHWKDQSQLRKEKTKYALNFCDEVICDSGLFTLMFGAGRSSSYDLEYMKNYTREYIGSAKQMGINNLTIVESDVHKLLGMAAVFELRKYFEDSGLSVLGEKNVSDENFFKET